MADAYTLTVRDVAARLGIHVNTAKRLPPRDLPFLRVGGRGDRRYREADLSAYVKAHLVTR